MKVVITFLLCLTLGLLVPARAHASPIFSTAVKERYQFDIGKVAAVSRDFILTAQSQHIVPDSFTLALGTTDVENPVANAGERELPIERIDNNLKIPFPKDMVLADDQHFVIGYYASNLVETRGLVHSFHLPLVPTTELIGIQSYTIEVSYPALWGNVLSASAPHETVTEGEINKVLLTLKPFSQATMVRIMVGQPQLYDVSLKYELQNTYGNRHFYEIAFPPEVDMQKVFISSITPSPSSVWIDEDGNFMAGYWLKAKEQKTITFAGQIEVGGAVYNHTEVTPLDDMPRYLLSDQYWESNDPEIQSLASQLVTPENIYRYVSKTLTYNSNRITQDGIERNGAVWALKNTAQAACMEFTDLTIALMRAAGIPAREVNGFAYVAPDEQQLETQAKDVLHAWVQYWDEDVGWIHIDPTWGASTGEDYFNAFDTDHLIFALKGITSQKPFPAGSYRLDANYEDQHIFVEISAGKDSETKSLPEWIEDYLDSQIPWWKKLLRLFTFG